MCNYPVLYPLIVSWNGIFDVSRSHLYLHYGWFSFGKLWKSIAGGWRKCRWTILLVTASKWMFIPKKVDYGQRVQKFRRARTGAWWEILKGQGASSYGSHLNLWTIHDSSCSKPSSNLGWQWILIWHTVLHGEIIHLNGRCCIIRNWWEPQAKAGRSPKEPFTRSLNMKDVCSIASASSCWLRIPSAFVSLPRCQFCFSRQLPRE